MRILQTATSQSPRGDAFAVNRTIRSDASPARLGIPQGQLSLEAHRRPALKLPHWGRIPDLRRSRCNGKNAPMSAIQRGRTVFSKPDARSKTSMIALYGWRGFEAAAPSEGKWLWRRLASEQCTRFSSVPALSRLGCGVLQRQRAPSSPPPAIPVRLSL